MGPGYSPQHECGGDGKPGDFSESPVWQVGGVPLKLCHVPGCGALRRGNGAVLVQFWKRGIKVETGHSNGNVRCFFVICPA